VALLLDGADEIVAEVVVGDLLAGDEGQEVARDPFLLVEPGRVDGQRTRPCLLRERAAGGPSGAYGPSGTPSPFSAPGQADRAS